LYQIKSFFSSIINQGAAFKTYACRSISPSLLAAGGIDACSVSGDFPSGSQNFFNKKVVVVQFGCWKKEYLSFNMNIENEVITFKSKSSAKKIFYQVIFVIVGVTIISIGGILAQSDIGIGTLLTVLCAGPLIAFFKKTITPLYLDLNKNYL
jgi:hypothetical protein